MTQRNDDPVNEEKIIDAVEEAVAQEEEIIGDKVKTEKRSAFDKFLHSAKEFVQDAKLQEKFETLKEKTGEAVDLASKKIDEIRHDEELKEKLNTMKENVVNATEKVVEKVKENEELNKALNQVKDVTVDAAKKSAEFVSNKVEEIRENPDVQKKVGQAKDKTIEVAEKAVDGLKKWLKPEDQVVNEAETPVEAPVEENEVKEE